MSKSQAIALVEALNDRYYTNVVRMRAAREMAAAQRAANAKTN